MPRVNIYIRDELKDQMVEAGEKIRWSSIAQQAFSAELAHIASTKEIGNMDDVIERLRASKRSKADEDRKVGRAAGVEWAKHDAQYDELRRVAIEIARDTVGELSRLESDGGSLALPTLIQERVQGLDQNLVEISEDDLCHFYGVESRMVPYQLTKDYVAGFLSGANDVWLEVKDRI